MNLDRMRTRAQERRCADHFAQAMEERKFAFVGTVPRTMGNVAGTAVHDYIDDMVGVLFSRDGASNLTAVLSMAGNALTIALKQYGGSSNGDTDLPLVVAMRSATANSGDRNVRKITAASSMVVSSGSTLGHINSDSRWTYLYAIEDGASGLEPAVSTKFHGVQGIVTTTAEGGAGAADSAILMYSTTARTGTPFQCIGRFKAPQATAGTWATNPSSVESAPFIDLPLPSDLSTRAVKRKTADESVTSSTALQDDDHLSFTIGASEEWVAVFHLDVGDSGSTTGLKLAVNAPAGATVNASAALVHSNTAAQQRRSTTIAAALDFSTAVFTGASGQVTLMVWVLNGTTPGTVQLQFAQSTSIGTAVTLKKGSFMVADRIV